MLRYSEGSMRIASGELSGGLALLEDLEPDVRAAPDSTTWLMAAMMRAMAFGLQGKTETRSRTRREAARGALGRSANRPGSRTRRRNSSS